MSDFSIEFHDSDYIMSSFRRMPQIYVAILFRTHATVDSAFWVHQCTYAEAKKRVKEYVKSQNPQGHIMIYVGT